jgi:hydrogenase expression/formation protein HypE
MSTLQTGKLPTEILRRFLNKIKTEDERVLLGPRIGEDAALIRFGDKVLVAKTDPVTFANDNIGWYTVHVNANDIATMGVRPRWFMATILLPEHSDQKEAETIFDQVLAACNSLDIALVGGHTEITHDFKRPVVVGCMLGEAESDAIIKTSGAMPGDAIVLTKGIAIEGTTVLAREAESVLISAGLDKDLIQRAAGYLFSPGISVLKDALTASASATIHAMHDPTEGGLSTALMELALAAGVGLLVEEERIPILAETKAICDRLRLDPLGLLASGALLIALPRAETSKLLGALRDVGIDAAIIGEVVEEKIGLKMRTSRGIIDLPQFERDELARFFDTHDSTVPASKRCRTERKEKI